MNRPIDLKNIIEKIKNKNDIIKQEDLFDLFGMIEKGVALPKPHIHGKQCPDCNHRMNCKQLKCPMCHKEMRQAKRQGCNECKKKYAHSEYTSLPIQLKCGCRFCHVCKKTMGSCEKDSWRIICNKKSSGDKHLAQYHVLPCKQLKAKASTIVDKEIFNIQHYMVTTEGNINNIKGDIDDCCKFAEKYLNDEPTFANKHSFNMR